MMHAVLLIASKIKVRFFATLVEAYVVRSKIQLTGFVSKVLFSVCETDGGSVWYTEVSTFYFDPFTWSVVPVGFREVLACHP